MNNRNSTLLFFYRRSIGQKNLILVCLWKWKGDIKKCSSDRQNNRIDFLYIVECFHSTVIATMCWKGDGVLQWNGKWCKDLITKHVFGGIIKFDFRRVIEVAIVWNKREEKNCVLKFWQWEALLNSFQT